MTAVLVRTEESPPAGTAEPVVSARWTPEEGWSQQSGRWLEATAAPVTTEPIHVCQRIDGLPAVFNLASHATRIAAAATDAGICSPPRWLLTDMAEQLVRRRTGRIGVGAGAILLRPALFPGPAALRLEDLGPVGQQATSFAPRILRVQRAGGSRNSDDLVEWAGHAWLSAERELRMPVTVHVFLRYADGLVAVRQEDLQPTAISEAIRQLAGEIGVPTRYEPVAVHRLWADCTSHSIREAFACSASSAVMPIGAVRVGAHRWTVGTGQPGMVAIRLWRRLAALRTGQTKDNHQWMHVVRGAQQTRPGRKGKT